MASKTRIIQSHRLAAGAPDVFLYLLATFHRFRALVDPVSLLPAPSALLWFRAVCSSVPLFSAVVALVGFGAVVLHMTLRRANMRNGDH